MRNTKYFDLNIFDEEIDLPEESLRDLRTKNPFLSKSLTPEQKTLFQSSSLRKISLANEKWKEVCAENNDALNDFFKRMGVEEFIPERAGYNFQPFKGGKFWQMMDYLDGNYLLRSEDPDETRESYQNRMIMNGVFGKKGDAELLQTGWDLAINSALLSDVMPELRNTGSTHLLEHVIEDDNSLFYPSVTNDFQKRVVNEAFWQSLMDFYQVGPNPLEKTLTTYFKELDPSLAQDNILRWSQFSQLQGIKEYQLVQGEGGPESFYGLSRRAIENYGLFMDRVSISYKGDTREINSFVQAYIDAVNCKDSDGIEYFQEEERERLLKLYCVERVVKEAA